MSAEEFAKLFPAIESKDFVGYRYNIKKYFRIDETTICTFGPPSNMFPIAIYGSNRGRPDIDVDKPACFAFANVKGFVDCVEKYKDHHEIYAKIVKMLNIPEPEDPDQMVKPARD